ncbi:hypothetical protein EDB84DRAFT_1655280, partial [Lactarius hengduanensis]
GTQCPPPLGLPGPPFSPVRAATFTRKGGVRGHAAAALLSPVRSTLFVRTAGARGMLPPAPSCMRGKGARDPLPSPFAREGGALFPTTPRPFPLVRTAPYARKGHARPATPSLPLPSSRHPVRAEGVHAGTPPPVPFPPWPRRPVRAGRGHARARDPRPHSSPFARKGGTRGHVAPSPRRPRHLASSLGPRHPIRAGWRHARARYPHPSPFTRKGAHEGTPPIPIPIAPGPSLWPRRPYARKWGTRAHTPLVRKGVHEGTTPPAAPYARVRHTRAHPSSFARKGAHRVHAAPYAQRARGPRFPLVRATPFARKGGMRGQAAPSRGAPFAREWAHEGKPCRAAGPARLRALAFTAPAPRLRGIVRLRQK